MIYGTDCYALTDLDPSFLLVSGQEAVAQAIARRLQTPAGGLLGDPAYGYDLRGLVNTARSSAELQAIRAEVEAQCLLDQRVDSADVTLSVDSGVCTIVIELYLVEGETPTLTFEISSTNMSLVYQGCIWTDGSEG
jgi:phage baseplate assembly protein W